MTGSIPEFISDKVQKGTYFFLNLNPSDGDFLTVVCGGIEVCGDEYEINRSTFPYHGMEYIVSGSCEIDIGNQKTPISKNAGHLFTYPPNTPLRIRKTGPNSLTKYFVNFVGTDSQSLVTIFELPHQGSVDLSHLPWISENFRQLFELGRNHQNSACELLLRLIFDQIPKEPVPKCDSHSVSHDTYLKCRTLIDRDYAQLKSLSDLSKAVHVSDAYICRIFQKFHLESPNKAIIRRKMEYAAKALFEGAEIIKTVALQIGYEDPYHFSRVFKAHFGVAPSHFMKHSRLKEERYPS